MSDVAEPAAPLPRVPRWFFAALAALTLLFLGLAVPRSDRSTLRGDEMFSLAQHRRLGYGDLLLHGARPQVSSAPLHYMVDRTVDRVRAPLGYLGLTPSGYYRLPSVLFTAGFGAAAAILVALRLGRSPGGVPYVLVLCGLATFWFHPKVFAFACVDRPYALWNGLWLLAIALLLVRPSGWIGAAVALLLLASTATAGCFQILAIGIALVARARLEGRPFRETLLHGTRMLAAPALVGVYYALQSQPLAFEEREYGEAATGFVKFWLVTNLPAWIAAGAAVALVLTRPKLREFALPVFALAALLLLMPLIFTLAHSKGYSSPSRQYIWTTTAIPLALFLLAAGWDEVKAWRPAPALVLLVAGGLGAGFFIASFRLPPARNDSRLLACLERGAPLREALRHERPRFLVHPRTLGELESQNLEVLAEWIGIRYRSLPAGLGVAPIREVDGALISDPIAADDDRFAAWRRYSCVY